MAIYKLKSKPAIWWPVSWKAPADGGTVVERRLELRFVRLGVDEFVERWDIDMSGMSRAEVKAHNRALFDDCVSGWRGYDLEEGQPVPFVEAEIADLLNEPNFPEAFGLGYARFWRAIPDTKLGNSAPSPAGSPATGGEAGTAGLPNTASGSPPLSPTGAATPAT